MGIKGFENFIKSDASFMETIYIRDEIQKWRHDHSKDPTIIIDVKELVRVLGDRVNRKKTFETALFLGGRFQMFNEVLDYFFGAITQAGAKLVFIVRLDEGKYKDVKAFKKSSLRPNERLFYNMMHSICSKYGEVHVSYGLKFCAITAYANEHRDDVMALITRDTDFLVYSNIYEVWSFTDVDFRYLRISKFNRNCIFNHPDLRLNSHQMQLMLAISELQPTMKKKLVEERAPQLDDLISFVRPLRDGYDIDQLAAKANLDEDERDELENEIARVLSTINYTGHFNEDIYDGLILRLVNTDESFNLVLQFCKENIYFAYKLMIETSTVQKDLLLIDIDQEGALTFVDLVIKVTMRMCGILFMDVDEAEKPRTRTVKFQRVRNEQARQDEMEIIYPPQQLISLVELIFEHDASDDSFRWRLLGWLLEMPYASITKMRSSKSSKRMRIAQLTVDFLKHHGIIGNREANAIWEVEVNVIETNRSSETRPPNPQWNWKNADDSWVQIAHKYTITYELICHCLEVCGLRNETALILFDAYELQKRNVPNFGI